MAKNAEDDKAESSRDPEVNAEDRFSQIALPDIASFQRSHAEIWRRLRGEED